MKTSSKGIELLKEFEGCRLKAYKDQGGVLTIGYGHTGQDVTSDKVISQGMAEQLLRQDLENFEHGVNSVVKVVINQNQFDALVTFSFNVGLAALTRSSLLKQVNLKHFKEAADRFLDWCHINGQVSKGLLRRREAEHQLFLS